MIKRSFAFALAVALVLGLAAPALAADAGFVDVRPTDYFYDAVNWAFDTGVTTGTSTTPMTFSPNDTCTRGQVVTFLWRAMGKPAPSSSSTNSFVDVRTTDYFYEPVLWAVEQGITNGTALDRFSPDENCTSAQVVTFLWRAVGRPEAVVAGTIAEHFKDSEYYKAAVAWADRSGLFKPSSKAFVPDAASPRADIVTYLYLCTVLYDPTVRTPAEAMAEMTWGVNLADLYIAEYPHEPGMTTGYLASPEWSEPFGVAIWFWNTDFDWIAGPERHTDTSEVSVPLPDYDGNIADWIGGLFAAGVLCSEKDQQVEFELSGSRLTLADGSSIPLSALDGKYSGKTTDGPDMNGWYRYWMDIDKTKLPEPSEKLNGAKLETTMKLGLKFKSGEEKANYLYQFNREEYDRVKLTDNFLEQGANVIRLPITWSFCVNDETFEIDRAWLDMVKEEVDYILAKGAYCIIDLHDDYMPYSYVGDHWEQLWMYDEHKDYVDARFEAIWRQIADYFKDYSQKLMFETCNEPAMGWSPDVPADFNEIQNVRVNELNDLFLRTVRASGGKNSTRILNLAVAQYNQWQCLDALELPDDDYVIVQLHSYHEMEEHGGTKIDYKANTDKLFAAIDSFVAENGVPVIIGECGVSWAHPEGDNIPAVKYYFAEAAKRGIPCLWWEDFFDIEPEYCDRGVCFFMYDKRADRWGHPQILQVIKDAYGID